MMNTRVLPLMVVGAAVLLSLLAGPAQGQTAKQKKDKQNQLNSYVKQMQAKFVVWDLNKDKILDKQELAKAFRGPDAKPFDDQGNGSQNPEPKVGPASAILVTVPVPTPLVSYAVAELLTQSAPKGPAVDYTQFPDYQFLVLVAQNGATQVTRKDFDSWARQYAQNVQNTQYAQAAAQKEQAKVQSAGQAAATAQSRWLTASAKGRQSALSKYQQAVNKFNQQQGVFQQRVQDYTQAAALVNAVPPAIQQAFPLKR